MILLLSSILTNIDKTKAVVSLKICVYASCGQFQVEIMKG